MGLRRRIETELFRLGLQAKAAEVVAALARQGLEVSSSLVNRVRFGLLAGRPPTPRAPAVHRPPVFRPPPKRPPRRAH